MDRPRKTPASELDPAPGRSTTREEADLAKLRAATRKAGQPVPPIARRYRDWART